MTLTLIFDLDLNKFAQRLKGKGVPWQRYVLSEDLLSCFLSALVIYGDMRVVGLRLKGLLVDIFSVADNYLEKQC